jgi:hypothetical protein
LYVSRFQMQLTRVVRYGTAQIFLALLLCRPAFSCRPGVKNQSVQPVSPHFGARSLPAVQPQSVMHHVALAASQPEYQLLPFHDAFEGRDPRMRPMDQIIELLIVAHTLRCDGDHFATCNMGRIITLRLMGLLPRPERRRSTSEIVKE